MDVSSFFKYDAKENCTRFVGNKLELLIPERYRDKRKLIISDKVEVLGIFTMIINDTYKCGLQIPAMIQVDAVDTYTTSIDNENHVVCVLHNGSRILTSNTVMQDSKMGYFLWVEFISLGRMPEYVTHDSSIDMMDDLKPITGEGMKTDHVLYEIVLAHVYRDHKDLRKFYRHTDMKYPPVQVPLRDVSYGPSSTHSRMIGAYSEQGKNAALLNHADTNSTIEDYFRA